MIERIPSGGDPAVAAFAYKLIVPRAYCPVCCARRMYFFALYDQPIVDHGYPRYLGAVAECYGCDMVLEWDDESTT